MQKDGQITIVTIVTSATICLLHSIGCFVHDSVPQVSQLSVHFIGCFVHDALPKLSQLSFHFIGCFVYDSVPHRSLLFVIFGYSYFGLLHFGQSLYHDAKSSSLAPRLRHELQLPCRMHWHVVNSVARGVCRHCSREKGGLGLEGCGGVMQVVRRLPRFSLLHKRVPKKMWMARRS